MSTVFVRISKQEARKRFSNGETIVLCPRKLRPGFPFAPHIYANKGRWVVDSQFFHRRLPTTETLEVFAFNRLIREWAWLNASYETGYYPHFYLEQEKQS